MGLRQRGRVIIASVIVAATLLGFSRTSYDASRLVNYFGESKDEKRKNANDINEHIPTPNSTSHPPAVGVPLVTSPPVSIDTLCDACKDARVGRHFTCVARMKRHMAGENVGLEKAQQIVSNEFAQCLACNPETCNARDELGKKNESSPAKEEEHSSTLQIDLPASPTITPDNMTKPWFILHEGTPKLVSFPEWSLPFVGGRFKAYQESVDRRIREYRTKLVNATRDQAVCQIPMFKGEYGYELQAVIPHIYDTSLRCPVETQGLEGTTYLYWFSRSHSIYKGRKRNAQNLPRGNPFGGTPHRSDESFPKSNWTMPNFKKFYRRHDVQLEKPLFMIFNKFTPESHVGGPTNFISIPVLHEILEYLVPKYHIVYLRLEREELSEYGDDQVQRRLNEKDMIRRDFPSDVVILDDLIRGLDAEAVNLMIFSLGALCKKFVSVQGGNSVVASLFGGQNIIMAKQGKELTFGDFGYYHRFANTTISVVTNEAQLVMKVKQNM